MVTRPTEHNLLVPGFLADERRFNVALSRFRDVLIIIGNFELWDDSALLTMNKERQADHLCSLVRDVRMRRDVVYWPRKHQNANTRVPEFENLPEYLLPPKAVAPEAHAKRRQQQQQ